MKKTERTRKTETQKNITIKKTQNNKTKTKI